MEPKKKKRNLHAIKTTETKNRRRAKGQPLPKITRRPATVFRGIASSCQQISPRSSLQVPGDLLQSSFLRPKIFCWDRPRQYNTPNTVASANWSKHEDKSPKQPLLFSNINHPLTNNLSSQTSLPIAYIFRAESRSLTNLGSEVASPIK